MKGIPWTDATINPVIGCSKISPGCANCYAETMAKRLAAMGVRGYSEIVDTYDRTGWTGKTAFIPSELEKPYRWKTPKKIFVDSMGDLFYFDGMPDHPLGRVFDMIRDCDWHTYQMLTKRTQDALDYIKKKISSVTYPLHGLRLPNVWFGITVVNQEEADKKIPTLLEIKSLTGWTAFLSIEPMIGPIDLGGWLTKPQWGEPDKKNLCQYEIVGRNDLIDWIICGGESGPRQRYMYSDWVRLIRDQCKSAGVPFFFKGWGNNKIPALLDGVRYEEFPKCS